MTPRGRPPIGDKLTVRIPPDMRDELDAYAAKWDVPVAEAVRMILRDWIDTP